MTGEELERIDPTFVDNLKQSFVHTVAVARWLAGIVSDQGWKVLVAKLSIRDHADNRFRYSDSGDFLLLHNDGRMQRCEAKQRTLEFSSLEDFRDNHYRSLIVDVCHTWDRAHPKPSMYFITNQSITGGFIVPAGSRKTWFRETMKAWGRMRNHYVVPLDQVRYTTISVPEKSSGVEIVDSLIPYYTQMREKIESEAWQEHLRKQTSSSSYT